MIYPKWVYSINGDVTRSNKAEYDKMYSEWYKVAEEMYPNYYKLPLKERIKAKDEINKKVGYTI